MALMDIFGEEVDRIREIFQKEDGFEEARLLGEIEKQFYRFTPVFDYDRQLSLEIIEDLLNQLYSEYEISTFSVIIKKFVDGHESRLSKIYRDYRSEPENILLFQPESISNIRAPHT